MALISVEDSGQNSITIIAGANGRLTARDVKKCESIIASAHVVLLTKIDIADALGFDRAAAVNNIRRIAPQAKLIQLSARTGEGFGEWLALLESLVRKPQ